MHPTETLYWTTTTVLWSVILESSICDLRLVERCATFDPLHCACCSDCAIYAVPVRTIRTHETVIYAPRRNRLFARLTRCDCIKGIMRDHILLVFRFGSVLHREHPGQNSPLTPEMHTGIVVVTPTVVWDMRTYKYTHFLEGAVCGNNRLESFLLRGRTSTKCFASFFYFFFHVHLYRSSAAPVDPLRFWWGGIKGRSSGVCSVVVVVFT